MKTVSVSEIIRTAQLGNTLYVLASEAEAEIEELRGRNMALKEDFKNLVDESTAATEREKTLLNTVEMHKKYIEIQRERERVLMDAIDKLEIVFDMVEWQYEGSLKYEQARAALAQVKA